MKNICDEDAAQLRAIFDELKAFHDEWSVREDDPEEMWMEAPEMAAELVSKMEPIVKRLEGS